VLFCARKCKKIELLLSVFAFLLIFCTISLIMDIGAIATSVHASGLSQREWLDLRATQQRLAQQYSSEAFDAQATQQEQRFEEDQGGNFYQQELYNPATAVTGATASESAGWVTYTPQGRLSTQQPSDLIGFELNTAV